MDAPQNITPEQTSWVDYCDMLGNENIWPTTQQLQKKMQTNLQLKARIPDVATILAAHRERMKTLA